MKIRQESFHQSQLNKLVSFSRRFCSLNASSLFKFHQLSSDANCLFLIEVGSIQSKGGTCPYNQKFEECDSEQNLVNDCLVDDECNGTLKCCSNGCNLECMAAVTDAPFEGEYILYILDMVPPLPRGFTLTFSSSGGGLHTSISLLTPLVLSPMIWRPVISF